MTSETKIIIVTAGTVLVVNAAMFALGRWTTKYKVTKTSN